MVRYLVIILLLVVTTRAAYADEPYERAHSVFALDGILPKQAPDPNVDADPATSATISNGPQWEAGGELTLLNLFAASIVVQDVVKNPRITPTYELNAAGRFWIGQEFSSGAGWRISYWQFSDTSSLTLNDSDTTVTRPFNFYTVDAEFTFRMGIGNLQLMPSMGVQYGHVDTRLSFADNTGSLFSIGNSFSGFGLTAGLAGDYQLPWRHFKLYGSVRGSLLYGQSSIDVAGSYIEELFDIKGGGIDVYGQTLFLLQFRAGIEYQLPWRSFLFYARAGVEGQFWELPPIIAGLGGDNLGLIGPTFALGVLR